jgi:hypothetical protein
MRDLFGGVDSIATQRVSHERQQEQDDECQRAIADQAK